jgi:hypothetical protein
MLFGATKTKKRYYPYLLYIVIRWVPAQISPYLDSDLTETVTTRKVNSWSLVCRDLKESRTQCLTVTLVSRTVNVDLTDASTQSPHRHPYPFSSWISVHSYSYTPLHCHITYTCTKPHHERKNTVTSRTAIHNHLTDTCTQCLTVTHITQTLAHGHLYSVTSQTPIHIYLKNMHTRCLFSRETNSQWHHGHSCTVI